MALCRVKSHKKLLSSLLLEMRTESMILKAELYYKPNYITQHFEIVLKKHGLKKIRFHDLSHSCASLLYANGVSLKEIQEWLGHSDIGTTSNIYTHLDYSSKVASANAILTFYPGQAERPASGQ